MSLDALFRPRSVAVLGATTRTAHAPAIIRNLRILGFEGPVYPVNPKYDEFEGLPCYPSVDAVPGPVDLVAITTSIARAPGLLASAAEAGVRAATLYATGLGQDQAPGTGPAAELAGVAAAHGLSLIGPNCMGHMVPAFRAGAYTGVIPDLERAVGGTAIITQSGSVGSALLASTDRIGFSALVSTGNETVTTAGDALGYLVEEDSVTSFALFLEQVRKPEVFAAAAARALELGKPVVVLKVGRTAAAQATVVAHSGALAGSARVNSAFFEHLGICEVTSFGEMIETLVAFGHPLRPPVPGIGCVVGSGGELSMVLDTAEGIDVRFPPLDEPSQAHVATLGDWTAGMTNPADVWGPVPYADCYRTTLEALGGQDDIGALVVISDAARAPWHASPTIAVNLATFAAEAQERSGKPAFVLCNLNAHLHADVLDVIEPAGVVGLEGTEYALKALAHWTRFHGRAGRPLAGSPVPATAVGPLPGGPCTLDEVASKALFGAVGIAAPREALVAPGGDLEAAACGIGYPVVLKAVSATIAHKSDLGLVRTGIGSPAELRRAHTEMCEALSDVTFDGFLVVEQVTGHREMIVGLQRDAQFGLTVVLGVGGVMAEVLDDAVVALPPVDAAHARRLVDRLRCRPTLDSWRGLPPADVDALCEAVAALASLGQALGDRLESAEINPLAVLPLGQGVLALDGLVVLRGPAGTAVDAPGGQSAASPR